MTKRPFVKHHISWALRGLLAYIGESQNGVSFKELEEAGPNKKDSTRHLIKQLKKLGLVEIPVLRDPETRRFLSSRYVLTEVARTEVVHCDTKKVPVNWDLEHPEIAKDDDLGMNEEQWKAFRAELENS